MDNTADRKSVRRKEKESRLADRARGEVITSIMSTSQGRAWLWDRLSSCSIFHTTHVRSDAHGSAYQEGRRSVGLELLADIMVHCPDYYIQAMREANERHVTDSVRSSRDSDSDPRSSDPAEGPAGESSISGRNPNPDPEPISIGADIYASEGR